MREIEKPKICFITTPGELTQPDNEFANPLDASPDLINDANVGIVDFSRSTEDIVVLTKKVADTIHPLLREYDGFVVTGRKDTLHFIAPRLAFAFGPTLDKTIVVASTNILANYGHSNARVDLIKAAMVASSPFREVVIFFEDLIIRGTNAELKNLGYSSLLIYKPHLPNDGYLGKVTSLGVEIDHLREAEPNENGFRNDFEAQLLVIQLSPGLEPEFYKPMALKSQGVIFESFDWSLPARDPYSFLPLMDDLRGKNIPVMLTSRVSDTLVPEGKQLSGEEIVEALGGVAGRLMTPETAIAKFSWVIRRVQKEITSGRLPEEGKLPRVRELVKRPYVGEFGINKPFSR